MHAGHGSTYCECGNLLRRCKCMEGSRNITISRPCKCELPGPGTLPRGAQIPENAVSIRPHSDSPTKYVVRTATGRTRDGVPFEMPGLIQILDTKIFEIADRECRVEIIYLAEI